MSIIKFTNGTLASDGVEDQGDLFVDKRPGCIIAPHEVPEGVQVQTIDLRGGILSPGLIDIQLNGCFGVNFSETSVDSEDSTRKVHEALAGLIQTGVTSFLLTLTTATKEAFRRALPLYAPNGHRRDPLAGSESLGVHCEGPFLSLSKKGAHDPTLLQTPVEGVQTLEDYYGLKNLMTPTTGDDGGCLTEPQSPGAKSCHLSTPPVRQHPSRPVPIVRKVTVAPELPGMLDAIQELAHRHGTIVSMGHSAATYEQGLAGLAAGATMITHTFNAMKPFLHRSPGLVGLLSASEIDLKERGVKRPFFGLITDDIHLHASVARAAYLVHPAGCIVTTDGTAATGLELPDGVYPWGRQNSGSGSRRIVKAGRKLFIEGTDTIAGGTTTLLQCVSNLVRWAGISAAEALKTVTTHPAQLLGLHGTKGTLEPGADGDLVVLSWAGDEKANRELQVDQVWKFGTKVYDREEPSGVA